MQGQAQLNTAASEVNQQHFAIARMIAEINTAEPVSVVAVHNPGIGPVGFVDVMPLVNLVDGEGNGVSQSTLYRLPYFRVQGGKNAVICDPQVGDVGLAVYAQRDTEAVKETRGKSGAVNPGSGRSMDQGDGYYFGGFLNDAPERYIHIEDTGITIEAVDKLQTHGSVTVMDAEGGFTINAPAGLTINGNTLINGSLTYTGTAKGQGGPAKFSGGIENTGGTIDSNGISLDAHVHGGVLPGADDTGGPK